jgi:hypothetical protein
VLADDLQPAWLYRTNGDLSPFMRMLWTLDDLLFYGSSLWQIERDGDEIISAEWVPYSWWKASEGVISINEVPMDPSNLIYFPGPIEGVLDKDGSSLRSARSVAAAVESRTKSPIPVMELRVVGDAEVTREELKELVAGYNEARRDPEGATVATPAGIELVAHGDKADSGFMVEGRNAVRLDIANLTGVPAALLDGSTATSSLTYSTQEGRRNEFVDYGLSIWMEAIAGRLSQDDVMPEGQHVVFDQTDFLTTIPSPTGPEKQD